ncbi:hypothetical protein ACRQ5Q_11230 [Bradyrhizobium sp. PMVTL-01]|uniref:hypothetical protein n=1 Tax=Bradyrhizobium sp. PMVTL-01 TaxID=3434999 RepID=UPI003F726664
MNSQLDSSTQVERHNTYTLDKTVNHFDRKTPSFVVLNRHIERASRSFESLFGVQRGDRPEISSLAGDIKRCDTDGSFPLHGGNTTPDYFKRKYTYSKNRASAYGISRCSRMQLVGRADDRSEEASATS